MPPDFGGTPKHLAGLIEMSAWDDMSRARAVTLRDGLDLRGSLGVEIGPLSHPVVQKREGAVLYVDHTDAATLRRLYGDSPHVNADDIVEVDAIWGKQTLAECLEGKTFDYIIASHVAEHVPDLVTWLAEARTVLKAGGQLRLALPDKRFSSDAMRDETRLTDLLAAWMLRVRRPQVRDVLDHRLYASSQVDGWGISAGIKNLDGVTPDHSFEVAVQNAEWVRDNPDLYLDVHCLVVRSHTFAALMEQLAMRGLLQLACARMIDTSMPLCEFYVFMVPCDDAEAVATSWRNARERLEERPALAGQKLSPGGSMAPDGGAVADLERQLAVLAHEIRLLRASRSWRITAPVRAFGRLVGRGQSAA